jgi:uncharacterized membrane protein
MSSGKPKDELPAPPRALDPFRRAVLRGLAIVLPPLLTIVIFLWVANTVATYMLDPLENFARWVMVDKLADIRSADEVAVEPDANGVVVLDEEQFRETGDDKFVPLGVYTSVRDHLGSDPMPATAKGVYTRYVNQTWLQREFVVPIFVCLLVLLLYLLGKFLAAGFGRFFWNQLERLIHRLPLVRNVYSSVKQVTDFLFTEPDIQYSRVVAIEYPRKGTWILAFVMGEGMADVQGAAKEPLMTVFVSTSPMPFTGFVIMVKKSETIDLDISIDQAFQFIISCGVVVPPQQLTEAAAKSAAERGASPLVLSVPVAGNE